MVIGTKFTISPLPDDVNDKVKKDFLAHIDGLVKVTPSNHCVTPQFEQILEKIRNFKLRPDDVWIVSYPKCGKEN